jgi:hypothetical protein
MMDSKGVNQLVYYQKGVGTAACKIQKVLGASTGEGVNDNIGSSVSLFPADLIRLCVCLPLP